MTYSIFEGNNTASPVIPPRRPTIEDFGGRSFEAALEYLPNDRRRLPLRGYLQAAMAIDRVCRSIPLLSVDFQSAVYPSNGTILYVNSVIDSLTTSTVVLTRYSRGTFRLTWPSGSMPTRCHRSEGKQLGIMSRACRVQQTTNLCTVYCYDSIGNDGDSPDYKFNVTIWGE